MDSAFEFISEGQLSNIYPFHLYTLVYTETIDSVEGALRLANQTSNILFYSTPSNSRVFCARKYCNSCRNKGVDIIFFSISSHYAKTTSQLRVGGWRWIFTPPLRGSVLSTTRHFS